jgi:MscS family membrane protein
MVDSIRPRLATLRRRVGIASFALAELVAATPPGECQTAARPAPPDSVGGRTQESAVSSTSSLSPRAALRRYLALARAGDFDRAAELLEIPESSNVPPRDLARQLKAVLDRNVWFDLDDVSGLAAGDTTDGLPRGVDQIAAIRGTDGATQPVRLRRVDGALVASGVAWRFTAGTVARVPGWYAALGDRWLIEHLPAVLLRPGPFEVLWWQWIALSILVPLAVLVGSMASRLAATVLRRGARRTANEWDDAVVDRLAAPLAAAGALVTIAAVVGALGLYQPAAAAGYRVLRAAFLVVFFWALWRLVDVARHVASRTTWALTVASSRSLLPLGARTAKVLVLAIATVAILSLLGYPVASLVAGLGLGGLALALAAQKTVENVFGAFSIGVDQPFREGDFVKIEEFVGTVEAIGLRSTRFRTLDRTLITIPNGRLADMRLESFTARDRLRLATVIGLVYETTASQLRAVLAGFERALREHPRVWPGAIVVRFAAFGASSLDIEIMAWFETTDWSEFQLIRQDVLLRFMDVVEDAGSSFAFPTQTIHLASDARAAAGRT